VEKINPKQKAKNQKDPSEISDDEYEKFLSDEDDDLPSSDVEVDDCKRVESKNENEK
jgi:hypothetical protein